MSGVLSGKTAIVTGGTGALGSAVTRLFLGEGARVAVPYREAAGFERLRASLQDPEAPLSGAIVDLNAEAEVEDFFESVSEDRGGLDVLVNTAGGFDGGKPAHETAWETWQKQLDINLKTAVLTSRAAVPRMLARGGGAIVNVASRAAVGDGKNVAAYAASKRGVLALTDAMAAELRERKITVNAVLPSTIDTPENRRSMPNADPSKFVPPERIARVILFLCGPDAREVSGAHVPVYGRA
jgi:NAD(P)-dependent dehydrogenase (short-subunit alcohol dehydrogenase family)